MTDPIKLLLAELDRMKAVREQVQAFHAAGPKRVAKLIEAEKATTLEEAFAKTKG